MCKDQRIDNVQSNSQERKWCRKLTWSLQNENPDLETSLVLQALRQAFAIWQNDEVTDVAFIELHFAQQADICIYWELFPVGDNLYGFAEFPPPNCSNEPGAGTIRLNLRTKWTICERIDIEEPIDLVTLASHEIGHAIGIEHPSNTSALMHPHYSGSHRFLADYDRQFYRFLYYGDERPPV